MIPVPLTVLFSLNIPLDVAKRKIVTVSRGFIFHGLCFRNLHPRVTSVDPSSSTTDSIEPAIQQVPFAFDLLRLVPLCQQVEVLFSTLVQGNVERIESKYSIKNTIIHKKVMQCFHF